MASTACFETSFDSVLGKDLVSQRLRIASVLMPLVGYLGPCKGISRIGNFVIPCLGRYVGSLDSKQLGWELGDRIVGEI